MKSAGFISIALLVHTTTVFGQVGATVARVGYEYSGEIPLAPGQIVTLSLTGITTNTTSAVAASAPLPIKLSGISVTMTGITGPGPYSLPLLAVVPQQVSSVGFTLVTVQVPFELPLDSMGRITGDSDLVVSDGINVSSAVRVHSAADQIHILGDDTIMQSLSLAAGRSLIPAGGHAVTHADGRVVSVSDPATAGEEIVIYAVGLGPALGVKTGALTPTPAPTVNSRVSYDYRPNASPSKAGISSLTSPDLKVQFVGMSPGLVGVYQANVIVPLPPTDIMACDGGQVHSNLTITIIGQSSFDGAGVCVKRP
jgi:uncharacterized protein (TIGR03437 family)